MNPDFRDTEELVRRGGEGDSGALDELFSRHRQRLRRMVRLRLDRRLRGRIDDSDVLQETYLEASRRLAEYLRDPKVPFFVWLRSISGQKLLNLHRDHLGTRARDPRREVPLYRAPMPEATSAVLAAQLLGTLTSPSEKLIKAEMKMRLKEAIEAMDAKDREVLVLRHFEQLTNSETAHELAIQESAASKRYIRAMKKLKEILVRLPGGLGDTWTEERRKET